MTQPRRNAKARTVAGLKMFAAVSEVWQLLTGFPSGQAGKPRASPSGVQLTIVI